jgi:hypothetical protein
MGRVVSVTPRPRFAPGKGPPRYPLYRRLGGPQSRSGHRGYRKNPLPLPGIEPRSPGRPVRSHDTVLTELPRLQIFIVDNIILHLIFKHLKNVNVNINYKYLPNRLHTIIKHLYCYTFYVITITHIEKKPF